MHQKVEEHNMCLKVIVVVQKYVHNYTLSTDFMRVSLLYSIAQQLTLTNFFASLFSDNLRIS